MLPLSIERSVAIAYAAIALLAVVVSGLFIGWPAALVAIVTAVGIPIALVVLAFMAWSSSGFH